MTASKWVILLLVVLAILAAGLLMSDASRRYNTEKDRAITNIQVWAQATQTAIAR